MSRERALRALPGLRGKAAVSVRAVARVLDCPMREVEAAIDRGELRATKLGQAWLIDPESVLEQLPWAEAESDPKRRSQLPPLSPTLSRRLAMVGSERRRGGGS